MKKHHRARTENFPCREFSATSSNLSFRIPRFYLSLFRSHFPSLSHLRICAEDRDENAELANFPQKCSFPADGLSPLADTSSSAGVSGWRCPPFSLLVLPVSLGVCAERVTKISSLIPEKSTTTQRKRHARTELEIKLEILLPGRKIIMMTDCQWRGGRSLLNFHIFHEEFSVMS